MKRVVLTLSIVLLAGMMLYGCEDDSRQPMGPQQQDLVLPMLAAGGNLSGAIFTTTPDGGIVNENVHYQSKLEVYLDGGPGPNAPQMAAGLPDGLYVFQVTDPSGKVLLSEDPAKCRIVRIADDVIQDLVLPSDLDLYGYPELTDDYTVGNGGNSVTYPCHIQDEPDGVAGASGRHDLNTDLDYGENGAKVVQLMPFLDTPNPGGVYKAWVTPIDAYLAMDGDLEALPRVQKVRGQVVGFAADPGFGPPRNMVKTDNFKVREQPPCLYVFKYEDLDGNGMFDEGEPELSGWKILVTEDLGDGTSVQNEYYTPVCVRLPEGATVEITEELPEDWTVSFVQVDGVYQATAAQTVSITFAPGQQSREVAFGNWECFDLGGMKYADLYVDGLGLGTDPGIPGVEIVLEGTTGAGDPVYESTFTGLDGRYLFECLAPGSYTVSEVCPGGWSQLYPEPTDGCGSGIHQFDDLTSGAEPPDADFGNYQTVELRVFKYFDANLNDQLDSGEGSLDGFEFCLTDEAGNDYGCKVTDETGYARWTGLMPGRYFVEETQQVAWFPTGEITLLVQLPSGANEQVDVGNVANCVGLTPGYWKNWRNHYTAQQFEILREGTIAASIAEVDFIFDEYNASDPQDLTILRAFVLATQLTMNLTLHPELPNPSGGSLFDRCTLRDYPDEMTLGEALDRALEIVGGAPATDGEILYVKTVLDRYANQRWVVY